ncbi:MAG: polysaccharide biosynthesis/export family protein [Chitinophagales bacterium]|nr:polysaccharide biosynthesis/export family protein [Chitinophagales bacterium]
MSRNILVTITRRRITNLFIIGFIGLFITSCASPKEVLYLQDLQNNDVRDINQHYSTKLRPDDVLNIIVSSKDNLGTSPFNLTPTLGTPGNTSVNGQPKLVNYIIRQDGSIEFPVIGKIQLADLTILQAIDTLKVKLKPYLNDPIVVMEWLNFKFTVLGEVKSPGLYRSNSERVSIFDALGLAGDLTIYGNRQDIIVIREYLGQQLSFKLDLTNKEFLNSELFYIKQNDVIIVSPNKAQIQSSAFNRNIPIFVSIASLAASTITGIFVLLRK